VPAVRNGEAEIAYEIRSSGKPLMLIHGAGGSGTTTWAPLLLDLEPGRKLIVPDLRGSGATRDPGGPLALEALVDDMVAVADDAGVARFDLVGFSLGGFVAAALAARAPERVTSLAVVAAGASGCDSRTRLQFQLWHDLYELDHDLFTRYWLLAGLSPRFVAAIPADELQRAATFRLAPGLGRQGLLNSEIDLRDRVGQIRARTLVVGCEHDTVFPSVMSRELAGVVPGANYLELDSGHMVVVEAPRQLAQTLARFFDGS
jgi:pimeloyl-ACP methyl ester carboxylesterase